LIKTLISKSRLSKTRLLWIKMLVLSLNSCTLSKPLLKALRITCWVRLVMMRMHK
jgi:hypothetical protein